MRVASALLTLVASGLWLGGAARDYHDNQRNWLLWLAMMTTVLAVSFVLSVQTRRLRNRR